jgi:hypothetical protein
MPCRSTVNVVDEVNTIHVWMPDGRSLCDRRAVPAGSDVAAMSDSEFQSYLNEQSGAPACGSCLVLAAHIRHRAAVILQYAEGRVSPTKPGVAWAQLQGTRWEAHLNLAEFLSGDLDGLRYERIAAAVDPQGVTEGVDEMTGDFAKMRESHEPAAPPQSPESPEPPEPG